jgi:hypothetical protein
MAMVSQQYHSMHLTVTASTSADCLRSFAQIKQMRLRHLAASGKAILIADAFIGFYSMSSKKEAESLQHQRDGNKTKTQSMHIAPPDSNITSRARNVHVP